MESWKRESGVLIWEQPRLVLHSWITIHKSNQDRSSRWEYEFFLKGSQKKNWNPETEGAEKRDWWGVNWEEGNFEELNWRNGWPKSVCCQSLNQRNGRIWLTDPYQIRSDAFERKLDEHEVGRALYHLIQRRGFMSLRKSLEEVSGEGADETGMVKESIAIWCTWSFLALVLTSPLSIQLH